MATRIGSLHDLAAAVRGRRKELGLSQAELAARAHVSRAWVDAFESGKPAAELRLVLAIVGALALSSGSAIARTARVARLSTSTSCWTTTSVRERVGGDPRRQRRRNAHAPERRPAAIRLRG